MTELLSNNAVAVIVTPVAISLGETLGLDPRPLVVAVMFAATLAVVTPIGYQTNTTVYAPGGYRFTEFTHIGLPLNIVTGITCCLLILLIWPPLEGARPRSNATCQAEGFRLTGIARIWIGATSSADSITMPVSTATTRGARSRRNGLSVVSLRSARFGAMISFSESPATSVVVFQ